MDVSRRFSGTALVGLIERSRGETVYYPYRGAAGGVVGGVPEGDGVEDEEELWFSPGEEVPVFEHEGLTFGVAICADIENPGGVPAVGAGARVVFELATHPRACIGESRAGRRGLAVRI